MFVVHWRDVITAADLCRCATARRSPAGETCGIVSHRRAPTSARELDAVRAHLVRALFPRSVFGLVLFRSDRAFDINRPALFEILPARLGHLAEYRDPVPFGALLHLPIATLEFLRGGDRKVAHRRSARQVTNLRVAPQIADENYSIYRRHLLHLTSKKVIPTQLPWQASRQPNTH